MKSIQKIDDSYYWVYEYDLWKHSGILLLLLKLFFFISIGLWLFTSLIAQGPGGFLETLKESWKGFRIVLIVFVGLTLISYGIYALLMGGKYCVLFEMNEQGITHRQLEKQFGKARVLGLLAAAAGLAQGQPGLAGTGLLAASKAELRSEFARVKRVKIREKEGTVLLDSPMCHNQIYAEGEDFGFVKDYILAHLPEEVREKKDER